MQLIERKIQRDANILFLGDFHGGTLLHSEESLDQAIDMAHSDFEGCRNNHVMLMGDLLEAMDTSDPRFDVTTVDRNKIRPGEQADYIVSKVSRFGDKLIASLMGNHEFRLLRYCDYGKAMADRLGCVYGTFSSVITFVDGKRRRLFKAYVTHGSGSITSTADDPERREANMNLALKRKLKRKFGDTVIMAMGHTHKILVCKPKETLYLTSDGKSVSQNYTDYDQDGDYIHPDHRWYLNTGSMMKLFELGISGYAERAQYDPIELGFTIAMVRGGKVVDCRKVLL